MTTQAEFPSLGSGIINDTCRKVVDYFHKNHLEYTADTWNNLKPAMYEALKFFEQERNKEKQLKEAKESQEAQKQKTLNILKLKPNKTYRVVKGSSTLWAGAEVRLKKIGNETLLAAIGQGKQLVQLKSEGIGFEAYAIEVIKSSPEHDSPMVGVYFGVGTRLKFVEVD